MATVRLVGVGASAGGIEALRVLLGGLPADLGAAVLVVVHQQATGPGTLHHVLARHCALPVHAAQDGVPLAAGEVYVAPPDRHLLVEDDHIVLARGPRENGCRPAVDALFRSLALHGGPGVTGVVLSGLLDDGAVGLLEIVRHGGTALVQDPEDAIHDGMPTAALARVPGAVVRPGAALATAVHEVVAREPWGTPRASPILVREVAASRGEPWATSGDPPGTSAGLACPDCSGPLFAGDDGSLGGFRCRVGHAWSPESLADAQGAVVEQALFTALRALEDKAALQQRLAATAGTAGAPRVATRSRQAAEQAGSAADVLRALLTGGALDSTGTRTGHDGYVGEVRTDELTGGGVGEAS